MRRHDVDRTIAANKRNDAGHKRSLCGVGNETLAAVGNRQDRSLHGMRAVAALSEGKSNPTAILALAKHPPASRAGTIARVSSDRRNGRVETALSKLKGSEVEIKIDSVSLIKTVANVVRRCDDRRLWPEELGF